jgi:hypothetical protein
LGGDRRHGPRFRHRAAAAGVLALALAVSIAGCGQGSSSESSEPAASYSVKVTQAAFPTKQRLGETSLMRIGVRNTGHRTIPGLTVTVSIAGQAGQASSLPFGVRSSEPELAQPDRPVWVLSARYPRLLGSSISAGAETAGRKTFNFGPLKPGGTTDAVWKLSAVKTGTYTVLFKVGAGLGGQGKATASGGVAAGGSFHVNISDVPPNTIVTDSGKVVTIPSQRGNAPR